MNLSSFVHLTEGQVSELADGTLDSREHPVVLAHIGRCSDCRAEVAETRALLARARDARDETFAPPELWIRVTGATVRSRRRLAGGTLGLTRLLIIVAFAILAVTLTMSMRALLREPGGAPTVPAARSGVPDVPAPPAPPPAPTPEGGAER